MCLFVSFMSVLLFCLKGHWEEFAQASTSGKACPECSEGNALRSAIWIASLSGSRAPALSGSRAPALSEAEAPALSEAEAPALSEAEAERGRSRRERVKCVGRCGVTRGDIQYV